MKLKAPQYQKIQFQDNMTFKNGLRWRFFVQLPGVFLSVVDAAVFIFSVGFLTTDYQLEYLFWAGMREHRRLAKTKQIPFQ
jgi:uncharacterized membrane protein YjgN (DUF898 family)